MNETQEIDANTVISVVAADTYINILHKFAYRKLLLIHLLSRKSKKLMFILCGICQKTNVYNTCSVYIK